MISVKYTGMLVYWRFLSSNVSGTGQINNVCKPFLIVVCSKKPLLQL